MGQAIADRATGGAGTDAVPGGGEGAADVNSICSEGGERLVLRGADLPGEAPGRVLIAPWGEVDSTNGRFVVDEEGARAVVEAFRAHATDVPIDYEHQSLGGIYASPSGQAPAAGWIRSLTVIAREGDDEAGLWADVEWTEAAREKLAAREYRYLSPVVIVRKSDRRIVSLHSAALTNKPAIVGMRPIVNKEGPMGDGGASGLQLREAAGGAQEVSTGGDGADLAREEAREVLVQDSVALRDRTLAGDEEREVLAHVASLRGELRLPEGATTVEVLAAAEERLRELLAASAAREAEEKVAAAMTAGKLTVRQREWALRLALKDPAGFDEWAAGAPAVVMLGRTERPASSGGRTREAVVASARASFRAEPGLELLTSEEAWVRAALREAGIS